MFNFEKTPAEYGVGAYICVQRKGCEVGDVIAVGAFDYRILEIDAVNELMIIKDEEQ